MMYEAQEGYCGGFRNFVLRLFPVPGLVAPPVMAIDISETSIKYLGVKYTANGYVPDYFGEETLPDGVIKRGKVQDVVVLAKSLAKIRKKYKQKHVYVSLPEENVYLFQLHLGEARTKAQIEQMIEFELGERIPVHTDNAVFDYDALYDTERKDVDASVTVFTKDIIDGYHKACIKAGFIPRVFELEAASIARAVLPRNFGVSMIVDFGKTRTGITITKHRIPIFATTIDVGGDIFTKALMTGLSLSEEAAEELKVTKGTDMGLNDIDIKTALADAVLLLAHELKRHYRFWDTRQDEHENRIDRIESIILCGGGAALTGLSQHLSEAMRTPVHVAKVWQHMFDTNDHIPELTAAESLRFATVVGLLLRDVEKNN